VQPTMRQIRKGENNSMYYHGYRQKGEVSLFVVIFATLLLTIVTVSFVRIMVNNQQQASTIDLSQSAYDSAQVGVEDAKRAILHYQTVCSAPGADPANIATPCGLAASQINSSTCNAFAATGGLNDVVPANDAGKEVKVQNQGTSNTLDQAYTCTTITLNTPDYIGTLEKDTSEIIPLVAVGGAIDMVQIDWFTEQNYPSGSPILNSEYTAPLSSSWSGNTPPVLRAQLIQFDSTDGFTLDSFNDKNVASQSNANTLFLYPSSVGANQYSFATDSRRNVNPSFPNSPLLVKCSSDLTSFPYACSAKLPLPSQIGAGSRTAFLRLSTAYNPATYKVSLISGSNVKFDGVQPEIDSTGRASDMFRRVKARVKLSSNFPYPNAEIFTKGNFCKNFSVSGDPINYIPGCTP